MPRMKSMKGAALALLAFFAILATVPPSQAKYGPERLLYNCKQEWEPNTTICGSPALRAALDVIELRYKALRRSADPDVRFLAPWDRYYFSLAIWNCRNPPYTEPQIRPCIHAVIQNKRRILRRFVGKFALLDSIRSRGSFHVGLVERYPDFFLGWPVTVCGGVDVRIRQRKLSGTLQDCGTDKTLPLEFRPTTDKDLRFYSVRPRIFSTFYGRFERRKNEIIFVVVPRPAQ